MHSQLSHKMNVSLITSFKFELFSQTLYSDMQKYSLKERSDDMDENLWPNVKDSVD